jgi:hypothetical protein
MEKEGNRNQFEDFESQDNLLQGENKLPAAG